VDDTPASVSQQLVSTYRTNRAGHTDLVQLAQEVQRADEEVKHMACGKLQMIAEQMRFLQQQAQRVLEEAKESSQLHNAKCNLVKIPGKMYYLYERESGDNYFSLLAPQEWSDCPHKFLDAYRLEHDKSWTKIEDIKRKDQEQKIINDLMNQGRVPSLTYSSTNDDVKLDGTSPATLWDILCQ